jgi:hypothetical protein
MLHTPLVATLIAALSPFFVHPHVPKLIKLGGAGGTISCNYFTVPFNAAHLTELKPGFDWHLGFAQLKTEVPLKAGEASIPPGSYKLNVRRGTGDQDWSAVLEPFEVASAKRQMMFGRTDEAKEQAKQKLEDLKAKYAQTKEPLEIPLALTKLDGTHEEHLLIVAMVEGYETAQRGSDEANGGIEFRLRLSFGDLHRELSFGEAFAAKPKAEKK